MIAPAARRAGRSRTALPVVPLVAVVVGALLLGLGLAWSAPSTTAPDVGRVGIPVPVPVTSPAAAPAPSREAPRTPVAPPPVGLSLPGGDAEAVVVPVGVLPDGSLQLPEDPREVGWWAGGAAPGDPVGTVLVAGHVRTAAAGDGVLGALRQVDVGDVVRLAAGDGAATEYLVEGRRSYPKTALPVDLLADADGAPRLVLVTCGGEVDPATGHYADNVVVVATPVPAR